MNDTLRICFNQFVRLYLLFFGGCVIRLFQKLLMSSLKEDMPFLFKKIGNSLASFLLSYRVCILGIPMCSLPLQQKKGEFFGIPIAKNGKKWEFPCLCYSCSKKEVTVFLEFPQQI